MVNQKLPITEDVAMMFRAIIEDRPKPKIEKMVCGYSGFLYIDKNNLPYVGLKVSGLHKFWFESIKWIYQEL